MKRGWTLLAGLFGVAAVALLAFMFASASADPVIRHLRYEAAGWSPDVKPMKIVLVTDIHAAGPNMPVSRLTRIVGRINRLQPDLVLIGGDFLGRDMRADGRRGIAAALAPLGGLHATEGVLAVMGNHDQSAEGSAIRAALLGSRIKVLDNRAVRKGLLVIGGVNDAHTGHADLGATVAAMDRLGAIPLLLSHTPDIFPQTPRRIGLVLAGHTHCGQISWPVFGPLIIPSRYGRRYACGVFENGGQRLVVSAGVGTTLLPLRLNAPPDMWLVTVGLPRRARAVSVD